MSRGIAALRADGSAVFLIDPGEAGLTAIGWRGHSEARARTMGHLPLDVPLPATDVARTGEPVFIEDPHAYVHRYGATFRKMGVAPQLRAIAAVPLEVDGHRFGVLAFNWNHPHPIAPDRQAFIAAIARLGASAMERGRLFDAERAALHRAEDAQRRLDLLSEAARVLGMSLDYEEILGRLAGIALPMLGRRVHRRRARGRRREAPRGHRRPGPGRHDRPHRDRRVRPRRRDAGGPGRARGDVRNLRRGSGHGRRGPVRDALGPGRADPGAGPDDRRHRLPAARGPGVRRRRRRRRRGARGSRRTGARQRPPPRGAGQDGRPRATARRRARGRHRRARRGDPRHRPGRVDPHRQRRGAAAAGRARLDDRGGPRPPDRLGRPAPDDARPRPRGVPAHRPLDGVDRGDVVSRRPGRGRRRRRRRSSCAAT